MRDFCTDALLLSSIRITLPGLKLDFFFHFSYFREAYILKIHSFSK